MSRKNRQKRLANQSQTVIQPPPPHALVQQWIAAQQVSAYSGPLPPPEMLQKYNEIEPGLVNRIVAMAEAQAHHRQTLEAKVISDRGINERRGALYGFVIALVVVIGSLGLLAAGMKIEGLTGLITTIAALAGVFVYGRRSQRKENEQKREAITRPQPLPPAPSS